MYNRVKSFNKPKLEIGNQSQGLSQTQELRETSASKVRQPVQRKADTKDPTQRGGTGGKHPQVTAQADTIMAYTGRTAGKKMMRQLDGMNMKQLQALAAEMSRKIQKPGSSPGEPEEWRKRLHHINQVIKERTLTIKPGANAMENLKKWLIKMKLPPMVN